MGVNFKALITGAATSADRYGQAYFQHKLNEREQRNRIQELLQEENRAAQRSTTGLKPISPQQETERQFNYMGNVPVPETVKRVGGISYGAPAPEALGISKYGSEAIAFEKAKAGFKPTKKESGYRSKEYKADLQSAVEAIDNKADKDKVYRRLSAAYPQYSAEIMRVIYSKDKEESEDIF